MPNVEHYTVYQYRLVCLCIPGRIQRKPRKEVVANFRLKRGHDCLVAHLKKIGTYESSECTICQIPNSTMDEEHLPHCPKLNSDQQVLMNTIKLYWDARVMMR
jgi:hypothetical protein